MKIIVVHSIMLLLKKLKLSECVEKPPVAIVPKEWHNESKNDIPSK